MDARELERREAARAVACSCDPWDWVEAAPPNMRMTLLDRLRMRGITPVAPQELSDVALSSRLWDVLEGLSGLRVYLWHTDHLSDRTLYTRLWEDELPELLCLGGFRFGGRMFIDMIGTGSAEDLHLYLKYYANEDDRRHWLAEFPGERMPPQAALPYDRDRWLPQPASVPLTSQDVGDIGF